MDFVIKRGNQNYLNWRRNVGEERGNIAVSSGEERRLISGQTKSAWDP